EARVDELRRLHEAMDAAVRDAYGWSDLQVPAYGTPVTPEERRALERFENEVIDRLFALNSERAAEERRPALIQSKPRPLAAVTSRSAAHAAPAAPPKSAPRHKPGLRKPSVPPPPTPARKSAGGSKAR
ncbi:MAG TPA: hypothetical protein VER33_04710, partial [Polyangiaceae bacterium]|nr:hypothetical protein [Polyangiaceae bacterium]